jgi:DHA2 family methylenomycin A resistance protein-like MFS transporter
VGLAGGALNASRQVGSALGVALLGSLVAGGGFIAGMHAAGALAAATFLAAAGIALRWIGRTAPGM